MAGVRDVGMPDIEALTLPELEALAGVLAALVAAGEAIERRGGAFRATLLVEEDAVTAVFGLAIGRPEAER